MQALQDQASAFFVPDAGLGKPQRFPAQFLLAAKATHFASFSGR